MRAEGTKLTVLENSGGVELQQHNNNTIEIGKNFLNMR